MTNMFNDQNHIEVLIHEYLKGTISESNKNNLFQWIGQEPANLSYFNQISDIWLSASVFQDTQDFNPDEAIQRVRAKISNVNHMINRPKGRMIRLSWLKAAAILLPIILLSGIATKMLFTEKVVYKESPYSFDVPYGSKSTVVLPDGSKVVLNSGSRLTFKEGFGTIHRFLNLVGEGYFTVAKNKNIPFIVHTGYLDVRALGTEFNVKAYPEDNKIEAILIHGSIQINKTTRKGKEDKSVVLLPKQILVYNKIIDSIRVNAPIDQKIFTQKKHSPLPKPANVMLLKSEIDPVIYTSWKEDSWKIYRKDLIDLAVELERKYDVKIHFETETLKRFKFTGTLRNESIEQVLAAMRLASPIEYKVKGKMVELNENKELMKQYLQYYSN